MRRNRSETKTKPKGRHRQFVIARFTGVLRCHSKEFGLDCGQGLKNPLKVRGATRESNCSGALGTAQLHAHTLVDAWLRLAFVKLDDELTRADVVELEGRVQRGGAALGILVAEADHLAAPRAAAAFSVLDQRNLTNVDATGKFLFLL